MDSDNNKKPDKGTDDLSKSEYSKTWPMASDASISQALSEILRAAVEDTNRERSRGMLFYIAGRSNPIIMTDVDVVRIGRSDAEAGMRPNLDLTEYHGAELGVSRYHAEIIYTDRRYYLKDMGSRNGTWVNGDKIAPYRQVLINDGDQVRLGHFTMLVKFTVGES